MEVPQVEYIDKIVEVPVQKQVGEKGNLDRFRCEASNVFKLSGASASGSQICEACGSAPDGVPG